MTAREHPSEAQEPTETFTEWGVRWTHSDVTTTQDRASESDAENFVEFLAECGRPGGILVCRTVIRTAWHLPEGGWKDAGGPDV